jgi:uncharacterized protein (DUF736 family)
MRTTTRARTCGAVRERPLSSEAGTAYIRVRLYGPQVVRMLISRNNPHLAEESPMLEWSPGMEKTSARLRRDESGWVVSSDLVARDRDLG